uniref:Acyl-[acyl-carrier-protein] hydrolase n=1 Tax=Lactuca sativa TaxID=4236 RepID=A0A9R1VRC1_LACSA|nr:hypothetical protein LSAT_V11C400187660 [Lactuca sativa]
MNHLQETALNHVKHVELLGDGFEFILGGDKDASSGRSLSHLANYKFYSSMGDMVHVDTWVAASGKNGMQRDWMIRDYKIGEILTRASRLEL